MFARLTSLNDHPSIALTDVLTVVGREEHCNARIQSPRVSRRHCCLVRDRDVVVVLDLRSSNGIRVNGRRVEHGPLRPGDVLEIANLRYRLDLLDEAREPTPSPAGPIPAPAEDSQLETKDHAWRPLAGG